MAKRRFRKEDFNWEDILLITTPEELQNAIDSNYRGDAKIRLNRVMVDDLLSRNVKNRTLTNADVQGFVKKFKESNYAPIGRMCMYNTGSLADGQHRLTALQQCYKELYGIKPPIQMFSLGLTREEGDYLDTGRSRKPIDVVEIHNGRLSSSVRSALKLYARLQKGVKNISSGKELEQYWENSFKTILEFGDRPNCGFGSIKRQRSTPMATPGWLIVAFKLFQDEWGTDLARAAIFDFYTNVNPSSYMAALRQYIIENKADVTKGGTTPGELVEKRLGLAFYCFNRYRKNKKSKEGQSLCKKSERLDLNPNKEFNE